MAADAIATQLGAERAGARIRDFIDGTLNTASRRLIIETRDGGLVTCTRSIDDYHRDFLKTALKAVIGRTWIDESDALRTATRHLGFRRTGPKIERAFKSAIIGLLRQNELERNGRALEFGRAAGEGRSAMEPERRSGLLDPTPDPRLATTDPPITNAWTSATLCSDFAPAPRLPARAS